MINKRYGIIYYIYYKVVYNSNREIQDNEQKKITLNHIYCEGDQVLIEF